jgi:RNA polymerase sigma-70 factor (ECF subfamily)
MTDAQIVEATQAGDREAFRLLVDKYAGRLYSYCYRRTQDFEAAKDLAQEAFVAAYSSICDLRDVTAFGGWLFGIARNKCRMHLRSLPDQPEPVEDIEENMSYEDDAAELLRISSLRRLVGGLLGRLTPEQREVLEMFYWDGLTHSEISEAIALPKATVKSRVFEARRRLRDMVYRCLRESYRAQGIPVDFADDVAARCGEGCECGLSLMDKGGEQQMATRKVSKESVRSSDVRKRSCGCGCEGKKTKQK